MSSSNLSTPSCPGNPGGSHSWYFSASRTLRVRPPAEVFSCNYCTLQKTVNGHRIHWSTHYPDARDRCAQKNQGGK